MSTSAPTDKAPAAPTSDDTTKESEAIRPTQSRPIQLVEGAGDGDNVEVDDNETSDSDSAFGSSESSATTSLASSVFSFTYANGRRYHSDRFSKAHYFMPNDEIEQDRLDMYHHIFLSLLGGKLYTAPLEKPQKVLDVGTGTGIWAIDFADEHESAEIIGTDISPIQPSWVPPNVKFIVDDMEEEWTYPNNHFDYIHMRSMSGSFRDWDRVLKQSFDALVPGGYVEYQDYGCQMYLHDGTLMEGNYPENAVPTFFHHLTTAAVRQGRPLLIAPSMQEMMERAGFQDVTIHKSLWPLGSWPKDKRLKELGKWARLGAAESVYPFGVHILTKEGWTIEQVEELCKKTKEDLYHNKYYNYGWFVYGRKPLGPTADQ